LSADKKRRVVRQGAMLQSSDEDEVDDPDVKARLKPLLKLKFEPKFAEWDHTKPNSDEPPAKIPAFDEKALRKATSEVVERDKWLREQRTQRGPSDLIDNLMASFEKTQHKAQGAWVEAEKEEPHEITDQKVMVSVRLPRSILKKLTAKAGTKNRSEAIEKAVLAYIKRR
jgi:hypothetical protein